MIAYYFPPLGGIGSLRAVKFAEHLPEFGWEPTVLAPRLGTFFEDPELRFPEERVIRSRSIELSRTGKRMLNVAPGRWRFRGQGRRGEGIPAVGGASPSVPTRPSNRLVPRRRPSRPQSHQGGRLRRDLLDLRPDDRAHGRASVFTAHPDSRGSPSSAIPGPIRDRYGDWSDPSRPPQPAW